MIAAISREDFTESLLQILHFHWLSCYANVKLIVRRLQGVVAQSPEPEAPVQAFDARISRATSLLVFIVIEDRI